MSPVVPCFSLVETNKNQKKHQLFDGSRGFLQEDDILRMKYCESCAQRSSFAPLKGCRVKPDTFPRKRILIVSRVREVQLMKHR